MISLFNNETVNKNMNIKGIYGLNRDTNFNFRDLQHELDKDNEVRIKSQPDDQLQNKELDKFKIKLEESYIDEKYQ